jgi:hypothetical protein
MGSTPRFPDVPYCRGQDLYSCQIAVPVRMADIGCAPRAPDRYYVWCNPPYSHRGLRVVVQLPIPDPRIRGVLAMYAFPHHTQGLTLKVSKKVWARPHVKWTADPTTARPYVDLC